MDEKNPNDGEMVEIPQTETNHTDSEPSHDAIKEERRNIEQKGSATKKDRLLYAHGQIAEQLKEFGIQVGSIAPDSEVDKDTPITVGMLQDLQKKQGQETALQMADQEIADEDERIVTKNYLETRIVPSGDPKADLAAARALTNSLKNSKIAEEISRKTSPANYSTGGGAPAKPPEAAFEPTSQELVFMNPPYNLTQNEIVEARKRNQQ